MTPALAQAPPAPSRLEPRAPRRSGERPVPALKDKVLYLEGVPVAFWPGYAYSGTFFIGTPGYDPRYAEYRVGQYLMTEMIDDLCRDEDVDYLDYGFGDSEYKRRFADESWEEADALLFAPTFKGRRIRAGRVAVSASVRVAKRLLGEERQARLKQGWRRRRSANSS